MDLPTALLLYQSTQKRLVSALTTVHRALPRLAPQKLQADTLSVIAAPYHPRPVGSTVARDQQQQPPEETTTMIAQQSTNEEPQQSIEQPATTTQQTQLEKASTDEEQFESVDASETTDQTKSGQATGEGNNTYMKRQTRLPATKRTQTP